MQKVLAFLYPLAIITHIGEHIAARNQEQNAMTISASKWDVIGHYYEPISFYKGKVLKYSGMACQANIEHMMEKPGILILGCYKGDRITADNHELFTGM